MSKKDVIKLTGIVKKALPGAKFIVQAEDVEIEAT